MKILSSLFWRLYLSIMAAFLFMGACYIGIAFYLDEKTAIDDFYRDTHTIAQTWKRRVLADAHEETAVSRELERIYLFRIEVVDEQDYQVLSRRADKTTRHKDTVVLEFPDSDLLSAAYYVPERHRWLLVSDMDEDALLQYADDWVQDSLHRESEQQALRERLVKAILLSVFVVVALVLLLLVKNVSKHINRLIDVVADWARGDLGKRVEENMPRPLGNLACQLNAMAQELDTYTREQKVMVGAVSHELRTPLSKIQLALALLHKQTPEIENNPFYGDLLRYSDELEALVNQVLTFSRLRYGGVDDVTETIHLSRLIVERVGDFQAMYPETTVVVQAAQRDQLRADPFHIQLIIDNLLKNAFKYAASTVHVEVISEVESLLFVIEDDGEGIEESMRESLLMPFARADASRNDNTGGHGLGLAIVDTIVRRLHGSLLLDKAHIGGLRCTVRLPRHLSD